MELRSLRSLVALAEIGSLVRTAERIHLSPAAVHKQLKGLEAELGVPLYGRFGRQVRLTQAAEVLLPHIRRLLADHQNALTALDEWRGLKSGSVRVGAGPTTISYILLPMLQAFRAQWPDVEIRVETGHTPQLAAAVLGDTLDAAFIMTATAGNLHEFEIWAEWTFEIAAVTAMKDVPRRCRMHDLARLPFVLYKEGSVFETVIDRYFAEVGFDPHVVMRFDNAESIKAMLRSGLGVSMLPVYTIGAELRGRTLSIVRQTEPRLSGRLALVTRRAGYTPEAVKVFAELARHAPVEALALAKAEQ